MYTERDSQLDVRNDAHCERELGEVESNRIRGKDSDKIAVTELELIDFLNLVLRLIFPLLNKPSGTEGETKYPRGAMNFFFCSMYECALRRCVFFGESRIRSKLRTQ